MAQDGPSSNKSNINLFNLRIRKRLALAKDNAFNLYEQQDKALLNLEKLPHSQRPHGIIFLQPEFKVEALAESFISKHYFTVKQRQSHLVEVKDGKFSIQGNALWGEYIYALLPDGRLYVDLVGNDTHHSHIIAGLPVKAVGHAHFCNGHIVMLSNNSGHYKPSPQKMLEGIKWFKDKAAHDLIFEDHSFYNPLATNKAIRYCKASEIVNTTGKDVTKEIPLPELNKMISDVLDISFKKVTINKNENKENSPNQNASSNKETDGYTTSFNDYDNSAVSFVPYDIKTTLPQKDAQVISNKRNDDFLPYLMYTSLHKLFPSRFKGAKNLARFEAKDGAKKLAPTV
jgi:hypothetical protein